MMDQDEFQDRRTNPNIFDFMIEKYFDPKILKDSTTYQKILRDGRAEGRMEAARQFLLLQGTERFGEPEAAVLAALEGIRDIERLRDLGKRILKADVLDWDGLLGLA